MRLLFPQAAIACLLPYLALQVRALQYWRWTAWASMFAIQGLAFAMFPFACVAMAGATLVAVVTLWLVRGGLIGWKSIVLFALSSAAVDLAYSLRLWFGPARAASVPLIEWHPEILITVLRSGTFILLLAVTALTVLMRTTGPREAKWTVVGFGLCCAGLLFGDAVFAPGMLQVSYHATYFIDCVLAIEVGFIASVLYMRFCNKLPLAGWVAGFAVVLMLANGSFLSFATYREYLPENRQIADLDATLKSLDLRKGDLGITRARDVDDLCAWVPLLTATTVLFCRNGEVALTSHQKHTVYRVRQAFYLFFTGRNDRWVEDVAGRPGSSAVYRLGFLGEMATKDANVRMRAIASIRAEVGPLLSDIQTHGADVRSFFYPYSRVLIIDEAGHPLFSREALSQYRSVFCLLGDADLMMLPSAQRTLM